MNVSHETLIERNQKENAKYAMEEKQKIPDERELKMLRNYLTQYHKQDECVSTFEWAIFTIEDLDQYVKELKEELAATRTLLNSKR